MMISVYHFEYCIEGIGMSRVSQGGEDERLHRHSACDDEVMQGGKRWLQHGSLELDHWCFMQDFALREEIFYGRLIFGSAFHSWLDLRREKFLEMSFMKHWLYCLISDVFSWFLRRNVFKSTIHGNQGHYSFPNVLYRNSKVIFL